MKKIYTLAFCLLFSLAANAQKLTLNELISIYGKSYDEVTDMLRPRGWGFSGAEESNEEGYGKKVTWAYKESYGLAKAWLSMLEANEGNNLLRFQCMDYKIISGIKTEIATFKMQKEESGAEGDGIWTRYKGQNYKVVIVDGKNDDGQEQFFVLLWKRTEEEKDLEKFIAELSKPKNISFTLADEEVDKSNMYMFLFEKYRYSDDSKDSIDLSGTDGKFSFYGSDYVSPENFGRFWKYAKVYNKKYPNTKVKIDPGRYYVVLIQLNAPVDLSSNSQTAAMLNCAKYYAGEVGVWTEGEEFELNWDNSGYTYGTCD